ncbi:serine protease [Bosea beijingensis]
MVTRRTTSPSQKLLPIEQRRRLYSVRNLLGLDAQKKLGLRLKVPVYFKDPLVAENFPGVGIDSDFYTPWEPGLASGPTSARFAVVDYDASLDTLQLPAKWSARLCAYVAPDGKELAKSSGHFRQVSTWAVLQATLDHFESGAGLGRRILWGFEGSRLIVVPHAGYGENAYYDRKSKSLQFYYFDKDDKKRVYTCLSSDIVNHELAHAILDGIRPHYLEAVTPETASFHEFVGDITAILMAFRNNKFREELARRTNGSLEGDALLSGIAHEFGEAVKGEDYLRSAANKLKMLDVKDGFEPHRISQVLTGAVFDFLLALSVQYRTRNKSTSVARALWFTIQRLQTMVIQALDLLPPVEVTFWDYAQAMLRAEFVANPTDPDHYREMLIDAFVDRGILDRAEKVPLLKPEPVFARTALTVPYDVGEIASSRAAAYRFLDDNRADLFIPRNVDLILSDVFSSQKMNNAGQKLPRQFILQYVWREELMLEGSRFGPYEGRTTGMLCGATLVLDPSGNFIHWARKAGTLSLEGTRAAAVDEMKTGMARRELYLDTLARRIQAGCVGDAIGGNAGLLAGSIPQLTAVDVGGSLRFELTPHLSSGHEHDGEAEGKPWHLSS